MELNTETNRFFWSLAEQFERKRIFPMDPNILALVLSMNGAGIETIGSCQGHLKGRKYPYPWVTLKMRGTPEKIKQYEEILNEHNDVSDVKWEFGDKYISSPRILRPDSEALLEFGITPEMVARYSTDGMEGRVDEDSLFEMQKSGFRLAHKFASYHVGQLESEAIYAGVVRQMYANVGIKLL